MRVLAISFVLQKKTGNILWKHDFYAASGGDLNQIPFILEEGKIFVKSSTPYMYVLDPESGDLLYQIDGCGDSGIQLIYHDSIIYHDDGATAQLTAIHANRGVTLWKKKSPNIECFYDAGFYGTGLALHKELNVIFTEDSYFKFALKIPE